MEEFEAAPITSTEETTSNSSDPYSVSLGGGDDNSPLVYALHSLRVRVLQCFRQYQIKHEQLLQEKSQRSEEKRQEILQEANDSIEQFYKKRTEEKEKKHKKNA